jgi:hypothetical protein
VPERSRTKACKWIVNTEEAAIQNRDDVADRVQSYNIEDEEKERVTTNTLVRC